ncbi:MAG: LPS export ABC transporter permease LptG [Gammaproteobacteria bacterium]
MIINRYIYRHVYQGTFMALAILVSLGIFFTFIGELEDIGRGDYTLLHVIEYVALVVPGRIVEYMPIAILLGTILNLGSLASNSEIIAMQAAGVSVMQLLRAVFRAALLLAMISFLLADWVVPMSETSAREIRSSAINATQALSGKKGIWIKDENRILHIKLLLPNRIARSIEIYQLDQQGRLVSMTRADSAIPFNDRWRLQKVQQTIIGEQTVEVRYLDEIIYPGNISLQLLDALMIEPRHMSSIDLYAYRQFLQENNLDDSVESLTFWQKVFAPLTILVMCILAIPFILGSQRQGSTGTRIIIGILLGLSYIAADKLLVQLGKQVNIYPAINALLPTLLFFLLAVYLLVKKQSHGIRRRA